MTTPGLYRHFKGNLYRVLWVLPWWGGITKTVALKPDDLVCVCADGDDVGVRSADSSAGLLAKWSGNGETKLKYLDANIVIYVALYGEGRVSARTEREFEESIGDGAPSLRFERIGD